MISSRSKTCCQEKFIVTIFESFSDTEASCVATQSVSSAWVKHHNLICLASILFVRFASVYSKIVVSETLESSRFMPVSCAKWDWTSRWKSSLIQQVSEFWVLMKKTFVKLCLCRFLKFSRTESICSTRFRKTSMMLLISVRIYHLLFISQAKTDIY